MKLWDVGGQLSLRKLWQSYYQSCHAVVFIIDSTDIGDGLLEDGTIAPTASGAPSSSSSTAPTSASSSAAAAAAATVPVGEATRLDECRAVLEDVLQHSDTEGVPVLILANKQDREDCVEVVRIKEGLVKKVFEGEKASSIRDSRVLPVSALTGTGVREAVEWLRSRVKWNKESRPPVMR